MGQVGLLISLLLTASFFGLIPDQVKTAHEGRAALAEVIAANSSLMITKEDIKRLESVLGLVVKRNDELLSAALSNDILELSKVEAGRLEVERIATNPYPIIREVVKVLAVKAAESGGFTHARISGYPTQRLTPGGTGCR